MTSVSPPLEKPFFKNIGRHAQWGRRGSLLASDAKGEQRRV